MASVSKTFSQKATDYFTNLKSPGALPNSVRVLNPYKSNAVKKIIGDFYNRFFNDTNERVFILGINPGRFGGGITGIAFTDPIALEEYCGIKNDFIKRPELSSRFVYSFINEFGGTKKFYSGFFISALFPLALTKSGKNYNYYDTNEVYEYLKPYLLSSLRRQQSLGAKKNSVICLGKKNHKYLSLLNKELGCFNNIVALEHPRFIMQYQLNKKDYYIKKYVDVLNSCL